MPQITPTFLIISLSTVSPFIKFLPTIDQGAILDKQSNGSEFVIEYPRGADQSDSHSSFPDTPSENILRSYVASGGISGTNTFVVAEPELLSTMSKTEYRNGMSYYSISSDTFLKRNSKERK